MSQFKVQHDPARTKVALLMGGTSGEREISLITGREIQAALEAQSYQFEVLDTADPSYLASLSSTQFDVAVIALHGRGGEDGCIQGVLELLNIPYTGSGVLASALAMDKARAKLFYEAAGLHTPQSVRVTYAEKPKLSELISEVGLPCVVKPSSEGSALGVTIVRTDTQLQDAIDEAFQHDKAILVERFITGTEITVGVLGNSDLRALPIIEIVPHAEFYDFEAKYSAGGSDHIIPARLSDELACTVEQAALTAHQALGCRGFSRTDMIVDEQGVCWVLETNTIPGMTPTSLFPDAARHAGIGFEELTSHLIDLALES